jgi:hypothetical protein
VKEKNRSYFSPNKLAYITTPNQMNYHQIIQNQYYNYTTMMQADLILMDKSESSEMNMDYKIERDLLQRDLIFDRLQHSNSTNYVVAIFS